MKVNFLDINNKNIISEIKKSRVYIYGAGDWAHTIRRFLEKLDICIWGYVVDDEYYNKDMTITDEKNLEIVSLREMLKIENESKNLHLFWGIASPSKLKKSIKEDTIKEVWMVYDAINLWVDHDFAHKNEKEFADTKLLFKDSISIKTFDGYLKIFDGNPLDDIQNIVDGTYFNELTEISREGCFLDCGAFIGDTAIQYAKLYGNDRKIYSFEPDFNNYNKLCENTKDLNIVRVNAGCWSEKRVLHFDNCGTGSSCVLESGESIINVVSIDDVVGEDKVAFVKMDVEGSELQALMGMKNILKRDMPILAISAYHKQEDLITLPQYIRQFESENEYYELFLRHHGCVTAELVLYAIPTPKVV